MSSTENNDSENETKEEIKPFKSDDVGKANPSTVEAIKNGGTKAQQAAAKRALQVKLLKDEWIANMRKQQEMNIKSLNDEYEGCIRNIQEQAFKPGVTLVPYELKLKYGGKKKKEIPKEPVKEPEIEDPGVAAFGSDDESEDEEPIQPVRVKPQQQRQNPVKQNRNVKLQQQYAAPQQQPVYQQRPQLAPAPTAFQYPSSIGFLGDEYAYLNGLY